MSNIQGRLAIASRVAAATFGGYALAAATAVCLALVLPLARSEAVLTGIMVGLLRGQARFIHEHFQKEKQVEPENRYATRN